MVVTIKDDLTADYISLIQGFDFAISIGQKYKMIIKPIEKQQRIDGVEDGYDFYQSIRDVWLLIKGYTHKGLGWVWENFYSKHYHSAHDQKSLPFAQL